MDELLHGVILKGVGGNYDVICENEIIRCRAGGRLRQSREPLAAGDSVTLKRSGAEGYLLTREPRRNGMIRPAIANIDQLVIFASEAPPVTDPYLIDKMTVIALYEEIQPIIVLNKTDLNPSEQLYQAYLSAGFPVLRISSVTGEGIHALYCLLAGKISAFTGNSAIGKSSVLNCLDSRLQLPVGNLSEKIERGRHTTRHVELLQLPNGGFVADTPGFSTFDAVRMEKLTKDTLPNYFPELDGLFGQCRFADCHHLHEPGCAVVQAVKQGAVSRSRYDSYCRLFDEVSKQNQWK